MLQDMIQPQEQFSLEEISSPLNEQILEFCESELFTETLQNSEVASNSNCCYEDQSSYSTITTTTMPFTQEDLNNFNTTTQPPTTTTTTTNHHLTTIFDSPEDIENDISASIDFTTTFTQQDQFDFSILSTTQIPLNEDNNYHQSVIPPLNVCPPLPLLCEDQDQCFSALPPNSYSTTCSFLDPSLMNLNSFLPNSLTSATTLSTENSGITIPGNLFFGSELQPQELDFQGDNGGIFYQEPLPRVYNSSEIQALSNESQHLVNGVGSSSTTLGSEITSLEDSTFKVRKLSAEQRKEKIHRYMKKRNERNFSKKIKYACRKTLADSRPRVRGRFAKNDEFGDTTRTTCSTHEEDTEEDGRSIHVVVKEEQQMVDPSDIFAHISGMNSFKCNYPIQSWI
ncbi:hypothetical protein LguiB_013961 [Lonicera macranthoides]